MLSKSVYHYGSPETLPKPIPLRAGPVTMIFEPHTGFLRQLRLGDHEIVRAIYAAVRNQHWGTVPPLVSNLQTQIRADSFCLTFDVECRQKDIDFFWQGNIAGESSGRICFSFDGTARSSFLRNRLGICALHPIAECSGKPCAIEHPDSSLEQGRFPDSIAPEQPFKNIRAVSYEIAGNRAEIRFTGEIFEMEDQRNWTDASFKTYCTPLDLPMPVRVEAGTRLQQTATLTFKEPVRPVLPVLQGRPPQFSISTTPARPLPPLGLCVAGHSDPLTPREVDRLKLLRLAHLRVELKLASAQFPAQLEQAWNQARQLNAGLHVALVLSDNAEAELARLLVELQRVKPKVLLWLVFHELEPATSEKWVLRAQDELKGYAPNTLLAAGTREFFVEINRARPSPNSVAFPCYSINPQVHMFDNTTLVENLAAQVDTVQDCKRFSARPVVLSPISLRSPFNPSTIDPDLPLDVDTRQMSLFCAGWTLGSVARLAATGHVHSLTYYETTGWRGVMETESGPPVPAKFSSQPGVVFPVYHVLADIGEFAGQQVYPTHSSHPLQTEGLTLFNHQGQRRVLVANLTEETLPVKIKTGTCRARVRHLNETNVEEAMRSPDTFRAQAGEWVDSVASKLELVLLPFAVARVDIE
jgi:hypothetical protein